MASLKDKIKSKIKSRAEVEVMQSFDQTSLNVSLIQGKNQLSQLKVFSSWIAKNNTKQPKCKCKWYNRTENNYQEIVGIQDEIYQPSILDVDSIVEVTCVPQLPGVNYEGMPFLLKSKPITLATDTQSEAKKMLEMGKTRLILNIKSAKIKGIAVAPGTEGMLYIQQQKLTISEVKFGQINDQILKTITIDSTFPQITINRRIPRQILFKLNEEESCVLCFKNHQIRDAFYLFLQLYHAKKAFETEQKEETIKQSQETCESIQKLPSLKEPAKQQSHQSQKSQEVKEETNDQIKQQKTQTTVKQASTQKIEDIAHPILQQVKPLKEAQIKQIKVESPKKVQEKVIYKQSTSDVLQSAKLKQEIKRLEQQNVKLTKELEQQKNKIVDLQMKIQQFNERLNNATVNYFALQKQLKNKEQIVCNLKKELDKIKDIQNSKIQEVIYYKNEIKLLKQQNSQLSQSNVALLKSCEEYKSQVQMFQQKYINNNSPYSYKELFQELNSSKQAQKQLKLKYEFELEQKEKIEQNLRDSRNLIEQIQSEKKHIEKKYQSLTTELVSNSISPNLASRYSERFSDKSPQASLTGSFILDQIPNLEKIQSLPKKVSSEHDYREKQILELKRQLKDYVEENNNLRSLIQKQKKSTSRAHLKVQLIDAKKIVSRLSETIAEKQMNITQLKEINKELNKKNQQLEQKIVTLNAMKS